MALNITNLGSGGNITPSGATFTTSSHTFTSGRLYLLVAARSTSLGGAITSASGGGVTTWAKATATSSATAFGAYIEIWAGVCSSTTTGTITVTYESTLSSTCGYIIDEVTGYDSSGTFVQTKTSSDDSASPVAVTFSAFGSSNNRPYSAAYNNSFGSPTLTQPSGHTVLGSASPSTGHLIKSAWHATSADTACSWTGTGAGDYYGLIGLEIKAVSITDAYTTTVKNSLMMMGVGI